MVNQMTVAFGLDVSKATSAVAVVNDGVTVKQFKIDNNWFGFQNLLKEMKEYAKPQIVFEATGVYSRRVQRFLEDNHYAYTRLNPLAAKKQLDSLRPNKTDNNDALHLAQTQLVIKRRLEYYQKPVYHDLMDDSHFYEQLNEDVVREKNRLHRSLQLTFPEIESLLSRPDGEQYWNIVQRYPHPDLLEELSPDELGKIIMATTPKNISLNRATMVAKKLLHLAQASYPADRVEAPSVSQTRYHAKRVSELTRNKQQLIKAMTALAKTLPEFDILMSIPGFAETTTVLLIGELGDIRRFGSSNQLNAFIGIDLRHYESGEFVAADHISKRGDTFARKLLFRTISNIATVAHYHPNHINDFYQRRKKQSPQSGTKKIAIAAMGRLLRTIYHLVITNQMYIYGVKRQSF